MNAQHEKEEIHQDYVKVLLDFFETIFQTILYVRQVYPCHIFQETVSSITGQLSFTSRHSTLRSYIHDLVHSFKPWLSSGLIKKVILSILANKNRSSDQQTDKRLIIEQFVFEIDDIEANFQSGEDVNVDSELFGSLYWSLRDFFVKVHALQPLDLSLYDIDEESITFAVNVQANRSPQLQLPSNMDWSIVCDDDDGNEETMTDRCVVSSLRSIHNERTGVKIQLYMKRWLT